MRIRLAALAAALLAGAGMPQAAPPAVPSAATTDARLATARRIVEIVNPFEQMVDGNIVGWESAARRGLALDAAAGKLEADYPGVFDAAIAAGRTPGPHLSQADSQEMLDYKAQILAQRLSAAELGQVLRFFESDPGRRSIQGLYANLDPARIGSDLATRRSQTGSAVVTTQDAIKVEQAAAAKMMAGVSADQQLAIMRFSRSGAGTKFSAAVREADVKLVEMANHPDPQWMVKQREVMRDAVLAFVDSKKKI